MRRPVWWLAPLMAIIAVLGVIAEISVLIWSANLIGFWPNLVLVMLCSAIGVWLTRREGVKVWKSLLSAMSAGRIPTGSLADGALIMLGGVLLILPGYLTDLVGLLLLLPFTRPVIRSGVGRIVAATMRPTRLQATVVEGEMVKRDDTSDEKGPEGGQHPTISGEVLE